MLAGPNEAEAVVVLIVDDDEDFRLSLGELLKALGLQVLAAADGADALALLRARDVTLIITDLNMPRMDGRELMRRLRAMPSAPPIVVATGTESVDGNLRQAVADLGACALLVKPFGADQLKAAVALARAAGRRAPPS